MNQKITTSLLVFFYCLNLHAQLTYFQEKGKFYSTTSNKKWVVDKRTITFGNQGEMHSEYLALNSDSTFLFVGHYEPWNGFAKGKWQKTTKEKISLTWDSLETMKILKNEDSLKYYDIGHLSSALRIDDWRFLRQKNYLKSLGFDGDVISTMKMIDSAVQRIDKLNLKIEKDTGIVFNPSGDSVGRSITSYYFDIPENYKKVVTEHDQTSIIIHFINTKIIRFVEVSKNSAIVNMTYFYGPRVVYSSRNSTPESDFDFAESLQKGSIKKENEIRKKTRDKK